MKQKLRAEDAKKLGDRIPPNKAWDNSKIGLIRCIVQQKFADNQDLKEKLINTRGFKLEEATFDQYWGTGVPVYSKEFKKTNYPGKNIMGKILEEIREELLMKAGLTVSNPPFAEQQTTVSGNTTTPDVETFGKLDDTSLEISQEGSLMSAEQIEIMNGHLKDMSKNTLKSTLKCLQSSNASPEVQNLIVMKIGQLTVIEG